MCYMLYLSTSSGEDLTKHNSELVRFRLLEPADEKWAGILQYEHKWFVGSSSECSCTFRHLAGGDLEFDEPQDWFPEEEVEIRATAKLYRVIHELVWAGERVDCLDTWYDARPDEVRDMVVALSGISEREFRLFENHHFEFEQ